MRLCSWFDILGIKVSHSKDTFWLKNLSHPLGWLFQIGISIFFSFIKIFFFITKCILYSTTFISALLKNTTFHLSSFLNILIVFLLQKKSTHQFICRLFRLLTVISDYFLKFHVQLKVFFMEGARWNLTADPELQKNLLHFDSTFLFNSIENNESMKIYCLFQVSFKTENFDHSNEKKYFFYFCFHLFFIILFKNSVILG